MTMHCEFQITLQVKVKGRRGQQKQKISKIQEVVRCFTQATKSPLVSLSGLMTLICACMLSCSAVQLSASLWTAVCQAPLSMGFSGKNIKVGCHFLLQGIFLTQESNPCLLHWQVASLPTEPAGSLFQSQIGLFSKKGNRVIQIEKGGEGTRQH